MTMIVIDTHIFIWIFSCPTKLTAKAVKAMAEAEKLIIPSIVLWETAMLASRDRITLPRPWSAWLKQACKQPGFQIQPITPDIAVLSATMEMHRDPADRLVVATAKALGLPLITVDGAIRDAGLVSTIW
ncbi:type II toxin-antitoxin system VapC family toxin [Desulfosarcina sp. OttesenSCG-928-G10]|nr:type II toxin-antitoxin system VapC family toxin [Desulfosarcina sp. OttesenSCG-928-G10]MDL2321355.1 type II toxin-antitoxin system VapC family toxin [Desulfosarcina sp. OttesenSCG-928-B08]